jgi:deltex-like protein
MAGFKNNKTLLAKRRKKQAKRHALNKKKNLKKKKAEEEKKRKERAEFTCSFSVTNEKFPQPELCCNIYRSVPEEALEEDDRCQICLYGFGGDEEGASILTKCKGHYFHRNCVHGWMESNRYCPVCKASYGIRTGIMPAGTLNSYIIEKSCAGFENFPTIVIKWSIPGGIQTDIHPNPGVRYGGAYRTGYLPFNKKGKLVYKLLKLAFERRLMFTVGFSITRGVDNVTIWNEIHAKTSMYGGAYNHGYPDDQFLDRSIEELKAKGITINDLRSKSALAA